MARLTNTLGAAALALGSFAAGPALAQTMAPAASAPAAPMAAPAGGSMGTATGSGMTSGTTAKPMPAKKSSEAMKHPLHYAARHHGMAGPAGAKSALAGHDQAVAAQDAGTARLNEQSLAAAKGGAPMSASGMGSGMATGSSGGMGMSGTRTGGTGMTGSGMKPMMQNGPGGGQVDQPLSNRNSSVSTNH